MASYHPNSFQELAALRSGTNWGPAFNESCYNYWAAKGTFRVVVEGNKKSLHHSSGRSCDRTERRI